VAKVSKEATDKREGASVTLFFIVLGMIVAYQLSDWMRGEPDWRSHTSDQGGYIVDVAGSVDQRSIKETVASQEVEFQYLMFARGDVQYALAYGDVSGEATADSLLRTAVVDMAQKVQGKIVSQRADTLAVLPAQRAQIRAGDESEMHLLCLWHGGRLYRLMAGGETEVEQSRTDIERFFRSFRLFVTGQIKK